MKTRFTLLFLIASYFSFGQRQEKLNFKSYSLSEFLQLIEDEPTDSFKLENANIVLDTIADRDYMMVKNDLINYKSLRKDSIHIKKTILIENVFIQRAKADDKYIAALNMVVFHNPVSIVNSSLIFRNTHFLSSVTLRSDSDYNKNSELNFDKKNRSGILQFENSVFELDPDIYANMESIRVNLTLWMESCTFKGTNETSDIRWFIGGFDGCSILDNTFLNVGTTFVSMYGNLRGRILNNNFGDRLIFFFIADEGVTSLEISDNKLAKKVLVKLPESVQNIKIDWNQLTSGIINGNSYSQFCLENNNSKNLQDFNALFNSEENMNSYVDSVRISDSKSYKSEIALLGTLNSIYKRQHDIESANGSYIALKNLETSRLEFLYHKNPTFKGYFTWKINQFLKIFSAYGTEPARAIVFSMYVILLFALIYLFFPNSWDKHGRKRIVDRYTFFLKYMDKDAGIHEVYMDEQKEDLLEFEEFKNFVNSKEKRVPKIFTATALPLYKWAISGTKLSASILKRIDIMKGIWSELPQKKRIWKSILLVGAFTIAIVYDIFIKMLNALMLSINTFTTLGFGEIPIKGLPRYLAIVEGFIGWFMLTIFSVSLISQLLN